MCSVYSFPPPAAEILCQIGRQLLSVVDNTVVTTVKSGANDLVWQTVCYIPQLASRVGEERGSWAKSSPNYYYTTWLSERGREGHCVPFPWPARQSIFHSQKIAFIIGHFSNVFLASSVMCVYVDPRIFFQIRGSVILSYGYRPYLVRYCIYYIKTNFFLKFFKSLINS